MQYSNLSYKVLAFSFHFKFEKLHQIVFDFAIVHYLYIKNSIPFLKTLNYWSQNGITT